MADARRDPAPAAPALRSGPWRRILRALDPRRLRRGHKVPAAGKTDDDVPLGYC